MATFTVVLIVRMETSSNDLKHVHFGWVGEASLSQTCWEATSHVYTYTIAGGCQNPGSHWVSHLIYLCSMKGTRFAFSIHCFSSV